MPRAPRIEYPGAVYHVMSRGVKEEPIFKDRLDYGLFLGTLDEACQRTGWRVHAYVLLPNHYHGLIETPHGNLVAGMTWFQGAFAQRFNGRHGQRGHVFQGRYKALMIDPESGSYFETVSTYIHLNPARARLVREDTGGLRGYTWSSLPAYLKTKRVRPKWLRVERVLGNLGLDDDRAGRRAYARYLDERFGELKTRKGREELNQEWKALRRAWYLGEDRFRERLLGELSGVLTDRQRASYSGEAVRRHDEREAEGLMRLGLEALGLSEGELSAMPKGDPRKCALAWLAHTRTTVSHRWLAERLHMGYPSNMTAYIDTVRHAQNARAAAAKRLLRKVIHE